MAKRLVLDSPKPLTKTQIIKIMSDSSNISAPIIKDLFDDFQKLLFAELDRVGEFKLLDLGKLKVSFVPERYGTNPLTGEKTLFKAKTKLKFSFSKNIKEFANSLFI